MYEYHHGPEEYHPGPYEYKYGAEETTSTLPPIFRLRGSSPFDIPAESQNEVHTLQSLLCICNLHFNFIILTLFPVSISSVV